MNKNQNDEANLERQNKLRHDDEVFRLDQEEKRLESGSRVNIFIGFVWIVNSIFWLTGMLEILLLMRFTLRLLGANPQNQFAQLIDNLSAPFIAPFSTLFISPTTNGATNIFDVNIVVAIVAYALLGYLAISLVRLIFYQKP